MVDRTRHRRDREVSRAGCQLSIAMFTNETETPREIKCFFTLLTLTDLCLERHFARTDAATLVRWRSARPAPSFPPPLPVIIWAELRGGARDISPPLRSAPARCGVACVAVRFVYY